VHANGINGLNGEYLLAPLEADVAARARRSTDDPNVVAQLRHLHTSLSEPTYGVPFDVEPSDVASAGWAVVFASDESADVKAALEPLIEHRGRMTGVQKVLEYRAGQSTAEWLDDHGTSPGNVDPAKVPYYLLLVGGPSRIPFSFQYLLDVEYAVGRLHFDDVDGYRRYVGGVIEHESAAAPQRDSSAVFFGTRHQFDAATQLSADSLVTPLADAFAPGGQFERSVSDYRIDRVVGEPATKQALADLFAGAGPSGRPAVLFSATHGVGGWPAGHPDQTIKHGALLCQDWPGLGRIAADHYFAGADLGPNAQVHGLVAFFFACFGAGTPEVDDYAHVPGQPVPKLAEEPFVAALPKQLLSHDGGPALAVIGHVDRVWGYSFASRAEPQLLPFQNALGRILLGQPVGYALKDLNERYATLSTGLAATLESIDRAGKIVPDDTLARLWTERNDAQNYVLLGDPAVKLGTP
jgi:hypothetical protein